MWILVCSPTRSVTSSIERQAGRPNYFQSQRFKAGRSVRSARNSFPALKASSAATLHIMVAEASNPQLLNELRHELTIVIGQCDMLEDILSTEPASVARVRTIKSVALRM